jgi:hypothetical protein
MTHGLTRDNFGLRSGPLNVMPLLLEPDPERTVLRPFGFAYPADFAEDLHNRPLVVAERILSLDETELAHALELMLEPILARHRHAKAVLLRRYGELGNDVHQLGASYNHKLLLGA